MENLKMEKIERKEILCAECHSRDLEKTSSAKENFGCGTLFLLFTSVLLWFPVVGWFIAPLTTLLSVAFYIAAIYNVFTEKTYKVKCNKCGAAFKVDKREYKKFLKQ